jgi:hypothetical protein
MAETISYETVMKIKGANETASKKRLMPWFTEYGYYMYLRLVSYVYLGFAIFSLLGTLTYFLALNDPLFGTGFLGFTIVLFYAYFYVRAGALRYGIMKRISRAEKRADKALKMIDKLILTP